MMGVYIKGMKMPKCCNNCEFHLEEDVSFEIMHMCQLKTGYIDEADIHSFPYDCPLVEVSEPHGRLIDSEKLKNEYPHDTDWDYPVSTNCYVCESIDNSPTVIEQESE